MIKEENLRIVFYTNSDLSYPTLLRLILKYKVVLIVIDNEIRHEKIETIAAFYSNIVVQKIKSPKDPFLKLSLERTKPNLGIVLSFDILPKDIFEFPELGTFNIHASCLPDYRGPEPIRWAIINGEGIIGLTSHWIDSGIDTGEIIHQFKTCRPLNYNSLEVSKIMLHTFTPGFCDETIQRILLGEKSKVKIKTEGIKYAPKIKEVDTWIDWDDSAENIHNFILGLSPIPGAKAIILGRECNIIKVNIIRELLMSGYEVGDSVILGDQIFVNSKECWIRVDIFWDNEHKKTILGRDFVKKWTK